MPGRIRRNQTVTTDEINLTKLKVGASAIITGISQHIPTPVIRRLHDLGFRANTVISCIRKAPLGSPVMYRVGESDICLRPAQAKAIAIEILS